MVMIITGHATYFITDHDYLTVISRRLLKLRRGHKTSMEIVCLLIITILVVKINLETFFKLSWINIIVNRLECMSAAGCTR